jgi:hypothetical protein
LFICQTKPSWRDICHSSTLTTRLLYWISQLTTHWDLLVLVKCHNMGRRYFCWVETKSARWLLGVNWSQHWSNLLQDATITCSLLVNVVLLW